METQAFKITLILKRQPFKVNVHHHGKRTSKSSSASSSRELYTHARNETWISNLKILGNCTNFDIIPNNF